MCPLANHDRPTNQPTDGHERLQGSYTILQIIEEDDFNVPFGKWWQTDQATDRRTWEVTGKTSRWGRCCPRRTLPLSLSATTSTSPTPVGQWTDYTFFTRSISKIHSDILYAYAFAMLIANSLFARHLWQSQETKRWLKTVDTCLQDEYNKKSVMYMYIYMI